MFSDLIIYQTKAIDQTTLSSCKAVQVPVFKHNLSFSCITREDGRLKSAEYTHLAACSTNTAFTASQMRNDNHTTAYRPATSKLASKRSLHIDTFVQKFLSQLPFRFLLSFKRLISPGKCVYSATISTLSSLHIWTV